MSPGLGHTRPQSRQEEEANTDRAGDFHIYSSAVYNLSAAAVLLWFPFTSSDILSLVRSAECYVYAFMLCPATSNYNNE